MDEKDAARLRRRSWVIFGAVLLLALLFAYFTYIVFRAVGWADTLGENQ